MAQQRTDIEDLRLQGNAGNLRRALKREQSEADALPLTPEAQSEIEKLNGLIAQALKCCKRGATFRKKPNPAFQQLAQLMKCRDLLLRGKKNPGKKSAADVLAEADRIMGIN